MAKIRERGQIRYGTMTTLLRQNTVQGLRVRGKFSQQITTRALNTCDLIAGRENAEKLQLRRTPSAQAVRDYWDPGGEVTGKMPTSCDGRHHEGGPDQEQPG